MNSKRMEYKVDTDWGRSIKIIVDLEINGGRVTVEGSQQVIALFPVEVRRPWSSKEEHFKDKISVISEQKDINSPIITAEIDSDKVQEWGWVNRPKLSVFCKEGDSLRGKKPTIEVSVCGNLIDEHGQKLQSVALSAIT